MKTILPILSMAVLLSSCSSLFEEKAEDKLPGERYSLYDFERSLQEGTSTTFGMDGTETAGGNALIKRADIGDDGEDVLMSLSDIWENKFWPQAGGYPNHAMKNVAFTTGKPKKLWSRSIGEGGDERMPLTAAPIVAANKVFTLNNDAEVRAFDAKTGDEIWRADVMKQGEDESVIGGGVAFSAGRIYVTAGFDELVALNATNGEILWRTNTKVPVRSAPSAIPGRVFLTTMDNQTLAFDGRDGTLLWSHRGLSSEAGVIGASSPAITRDTVVCAYDSGEVYALQVDTGAELWSDNLSPLARSAGLSKLSDIRALPVVDQGMLIAASYDNKTVAMNMRVGQAVWTAPLGTGSTPWISGNRVFVIDNQGALVSMDRDNGDIMWQSPLPLYEDEKDKDGYITWRGPVVADDQLLMVGSHGQIWVMDPETGKKLDQWDIDDDVKLPMTIAGGVLYVLSNDGDLTAYR